MFFFLWFSSHVASEQFRMCSAVHLSSNMQHLASRAWSCSELTLAGSQIAESMAAPDADVVTMKMHCLGLTYGMDLDGMEKLLKDGFLSFS